MPTTDRWLQLKQLFLFFSGIFSPILALALGAVSTCVAGTLADSWLRGGGTMDVVSRYEDGAELRDRL